MYENCPNCSTGVIKVSEKSGGFVECSYCRTKRALEEKENALHKSLHRANDRALKLRNA